MERKPKRYCPHCATPLQPAADGGQWCPACQVGLYDNPTPAVAAVVRDGRGRFLLVERDKDPKAGEWSLPGGFIEIDESPVEAAARELREETGLSALRLELLAVEDEPSRQYGRVLVVCYRIPEWTGAPAAGDDARSCGFFAPEELPPVAFRAHRRFIQACLENGAP
jgi:ADP-ribose pyrophosphatase YjhB (NUDIX family)